MDIPKLPNKIVFVGENFVVRLRQTLVSIALIAGILLDHEDLWKWDLRSITKLVLIVLLGLNGSPMGKDRK